MAKINTERFISKPGDFEIIKAPEPTKEEIARRFISKPGDFEIIPAPPRVIYAMIAKLIGETPEAVATINLTESGFTFETEDSELATLLNKIKRDGVETGTGGSDPKTGMYWDGIDYIKITAATVGALTFELEKDEYYWWQEEDED